MSNRVMHFEIPCDNPEKTMTFFSEAFGWTFKQFDNEQYWDVLTSNDGTPGINGGLMKKRHPNQPVVNSIQVDDIEQAIKKIEKAGGKMVVPKMIIPTRGWLAYFTDPDGNIHGIWQDDRSLQQG